MWMVDEEEEVVRGRGMSMTGWPFKQHEKEKTYVGLC